MKLDHNPFGALRQKSRSLRRKNDRTRIHASSAVSCDASLVSPKTAHFRLSHEDLHAPHSAVRISSVDVLLGDDKELHDPNYVRHNWEMMSGESAFPDNQLHIGRCASPHLTTRRSTLSSRTASSPPSSRGSEAGAHHTPTFGLGINAFSGFSSYSQSGSVRRSSGARSSSTRGLQVEGSILRDEEAILYSDDDSSDDQDDDYVHAMYSTYHLPSSRPNSRSTSRRTSPSQAAPPSPRSLLHPASATHRAESSSVFSAPPSPALSYASEFQPASAAYHRRRHWTVAEGSHASNGAGVHALPPQMLRGPAPMKERSLSQPA